MRAAFRSRTNAFVSRPVKKRVRTGSLMRGLFHHKVTKTQSRYSFLGVLGATVVPKMIRPAVPSQQFSPVPPVQSRARSMAPGGAGDLSLRFKKGSPPRRGPPGIFFSSPGGDKIPTGNSLTNVLARG